MKFAFLSLFLLLVAPAYSSDCTIENIMGGMVFANCHHYEKGLPIYDNNGNLVEVLGNDDQKVALKNREAVSFQKGDLLSYTKPLPLISNTDPRHPASLDPFESDFMKVYLTGVRYQYSSLEGDFDTTGLNAEFEMTGGDLKTLPLSFDFEFLFENLGIILSPDFKNDSGEISVYSRNDFLNFGLFLSINNQSNEQTLTINNTKLLSEDKDSSSITAGFLIRENIDFESWQLLTDFRIGYFKETSSFSSSNGSESEVTYDAGLASLELDLFYKVSKKFLAGFGFGAGYGLGTVEFEDVNSSVGDETDLLSFQINLVQMQLVF